MSSERQSTTIAGLVVLAGLLAGYFLPDALGGAGETAALTATASPTARAMPTPSPPLATAAPVAATATPRAASLGATPLATATAPSPAPPAPSATAPPPAASPAPPTATPGAAPATPTPAAPAPRTHVVQSGDNLWDLATRYGVTVDAIVKANQMKDPESLAVGQKLVIPPAQ